MRIEHAAMYVDDLDAARDFFVKYFHAVPGAPYHNRKTDFRSCFLGFDGGARLELMTRPALAPGGEPPVRTGYSHIAFSLGGRAAVDALTETLRRDGYQVVSGPRITGDGYYESCILGPAGSRIELTE